MKFEWSISILEFTCKRESAVRYSGTIGKSFFYDYACNAPANIWKRATIGPPVKRHLSSQHEILGHYRPSTNDVSMADNSVYVYWVNDVSLMGRWRPDTVCWLGLCLLVDDSPAFLWIRIVKTMFILWNNMGPSLENLSSGFPTEYISNQPIQLQRLYRICNFVWSKFRNYTYQ